MGRFHSTHVVFDQVFQADESSAAKMVRKTGEWFRLPGLMTWGDHAVNVTVILNGTVESLTKRTFAQLRRLRR